MAAISTSVAKSITLAPSSSSSSSSAPKPFILSANGCISATCHGKFVAVKPGHPAYHRW